MELLEKEHFALGKTNSSGDAMHPGESPRVCDTTQVETLEMAAAAGGEKKGGATNASEGVTGQRQFQQSGRPISFPTAICSVPAWAACCLYSLSTKHLEEFLPESKDNK